MLELEHQMNWTMVSSWQLFAVTTTFGVTSAEKYTMTTVDLQCQFLSEICPKCNYNVDLHREISGQILVGVRLRNEHIGGGGGGGVSGFQRHTMVPCPRRVPCS